MSKKNEIQNNPLQQKRIRTNELIVEAGASCAKETVARIRAMANEAQHAARMLQLLDPEIIYNAQCKDLLYRAEHNAAALAMLLSSAADAAEYLNRELCAMLRNIDAEEVRQIKDAIAIARERRQAEKKHKEYERKKERRAKALGATIGEAIQDVEPEIDPNEARERLLKKRGRKPKTAEQ